MEEAAQQGFPMRRGNDRKARSHTGGHCMGEQSRSRHLVESLSCFQRDRFRAA
jgi:hypothetical protein